MRLHVFFSVHERLFGPILDKLRSADLVRSISGFVWGEDQHRSLDRELQLARLTVFTTDILQKLDDTPADLEYLRQWEERCGVTLQHMIFAERHLLLRHSYDRVLRLAELIFRRVEQDFDAVRPDAYFSEDVACLTSFIHWAVAKDRGARIVLIGNSRFPRRVTSYSNPWQRWELLDEIFPETPAGVLNETDYARADAYIRDFRDRPKPPTWLHARSRLEVGSWFDLKRLSFVTRRWLVDERNPTLRSPREIIMQRARRLARSYVADAFNVFDHPRPGERYVLYPLHFQPEATTLVLAPYFLNQVALIEDLAKSLPAGHRLYVKEHIVSRGRWPVSFYEAIRRVPGARLLSPEEDAPSLIRGASAVAVVTGTMGWEALLLDKPVITFGQIFYNRYPLVYRGSEVAKQDWPGLLRQAIFHHRVDDELLRRFVACAYKATFAGQVANPSTLPEVLASENIQNLANVLAARLTTGAPANVEKSSQSA